MTIEDIEASKAPLMDHLIELRSRLLKALLGFGIAFIFCFFFAKQIYNILVWPFVWIAGAENSKFIYTALLEYFITQLKLALFVFFSSRRRHTRLQGDWSSDVCSSDLGGGPEGQRAKSVTEYLLGPRR